MTEINRKKILFSNLPLFSRLFAPGLNVKIWSKFQFRGLEFFCKLFISQFTYLIYKLIIEIDSKKTKLETKNPNLVPFWNFIENDQNL